MDNDNIHSLGESDEEDPPFDPQQELDKGDAEDVAMHDLEGEKEVVTKKRKGRGPSKGSKVKEPMHLEYDDFGQPCGKWRHAYGKQLGACVRKLSIVVKWKDVPQSLKNAFWDETVNLFHIEATVDKRNIFISAVAQRFRDFKAKLVSGFITKKRKRSKKEGDDKTPPDIWPHVSKDDWEAFVAQKTTPQAIEKRSKATKSAKSRSYWHAMGPKTFEQKRSIWKKDGIYPHELIVKPSSNGTQSTSTSLEKTKNRMADWWCSLHGLDENGKRVIKNPATKRVADSLIDMMRKEAAGELTLEPDKDALNMVLGKEDHHGRVVGHGGVRLGVKKVKAVATSNSKGSGSMHSGVSDAKIDAKTEQLKSELQQTFGEMLKANNEMIFSSIKSIFQHIGVGEQVTQEFMNGAQQKVVPCDQSSHQPTPSTHVPAPSPLELEEETPCKLLLQDPESAEECLVIVADGHARPPREGFKVHGAPLPQGHYAVCVDHFQESRKLYQIPIPISSADINTVEEAHGTYVAWPFNLVQFGDDVLQKLAHKSNGLSKEKGKEHSNNKNETLIDKSKMEVLKEGTLMDKSKMEVLKAKSSKGSTPEPLMDPEPLIEIVDKVVPQSLPLSESCKWLHDCVLELPSNKAIKVNLDSSMLNHPSDISEMYLSKEDFSEFLSGQKLSVTIITLYMRMLYDELKRVNKVAQVGWLCPFTIRGERCMKEKKSVKEYILNSFKISVENKHKMIIAPYLQGEHWLLIVVCPWNGTTYVFDSLAQEDTPRMLLVKGIMNSVWREITEARKQESSTNLFWINLQCAQQDDGESCGYYIMRFMSDLASCAKGKVKLTEVLRHRNSQTLTKAQIDEVRDKFAIFVLDNFMMF